MPRGDGTGPDGLGPRTGRGLRRRVTQLEELPNATEKRSGIFQRLVKKLGKGMGRGMKTGGGRGMGRGMSQNGGRGMGRGSEQNQGQAASQTIIPDNTAYKPQITKKDEVTSLKEQAQIIEKQLQELERCINNVQKEKGRKAARVDAFKCGGCGICVNFCPVGAITMSDVAVIDESKCMGCEACVDECPFNAITMK